MTAEAPGLVVVLDTIEAQRQTIRESATTAIREVEAHRDNELGRLDRAVAALHGGDSALAPTERPSRTAAQPTSSPKRRLRAKRGTSPAATRERREVVHRYLTEQTGPVAPGQISRALKISPRCTRTALTRLCKQGDAERMGTGRATRYEAKADSSPVSDPMPGPNGSSRRGTLQGRILATLQDRGWATLDELVQATDATSEQVLKVCGALIGEEEIRMARREGRGVYVVQGVA